MISAPSPQLGQKPRRLRLNATRCSGYHWVAQVRPRFADIFCATIARRSYSGCGLGGTAFSPLSRETCTDQMLVAL